MYTNKIIMILFAILFGCKLVVWRTSCTRIKREQNIANMFQTRLPFTMILVFKSYFDNILKKTLSQLDEPTTDLRWAIQTINYLAAKYMEISALSVDNWINLFVNFQFIVWVFVLKVRLNITRIQLSVFFWPFWFIRYQIISFHVFVYHIHPFLSKVWIFITRKCNTCRKMEHYNWSAHIIRVM